VVTKEVSTLGTITDIDGKFELSIPANVTALVVSYTGYKTMDVSLSGESSYEVTMAEGQVLQEVLITSPFGGQFSREKFTGSAATISNEAIGVRPISNVGQALVGAAAGVQATFGSGQPGSAPNIRIRGFGSINSSNDPLYVVDGVPYSANIANLNTNDIENVTILKDASSTSLYGSRAANGVVMITTKSGSSSKSTINVKYTKGYSDRAIPEYDRIGITDYYPLMWEQYKNSVQYRATSPLAADAAAVDARRRLVSLVGYNAYNVADSLLVGNDGKLNSSAQQVYKNEDLDWLSPLFRNGDRDEVTAEFSGGDAKTNYFVSGGYLNDQGFLIRSSFKRYTGRINVNSQLRSWFKVGANLGYTQSNAENNDAGGNTTFVNPFFFSRGMGPIYPVYAYDPKTPGSYLLDGNGNRLYDYGNLNALGLPNRPQFGGRHVIAETLLNLNNFRRNVFSGRGFGEFKIVDGLKFTANAGIDYTNRYDNSFQNPEIGDGAPAGRASTEYINVTSINLSQVLDYTKQFGKHGLNLLLGHETYNQTENNLSGTRSQLVVAGNTNLVNFTTTTNLSENTDRRAIEGAFSRIGYDYDEKYFLTLSGRRDASSRFSPTARWGNFGSVGFGWRISEESFMKNNSIVNNLKLRGSYGTSGNENISSFYAWQILYGLGWNNATEPGILQNRLVGNPDLRWEVGGQSDLGLEFGLFSNRINGTFEVFKKVSNNLIFEVPLPISTGLSNQYQNIGTMENTGLELELNLEPIRTKNFAWILSFNGLKLDNKITKMPETNKEIISGTKQLKEGGSLYSYYLREYMGVNPDNGEAMYRAATFNATNSRITAAGDTVTNNINNARFIFQDKVSYNPYSGGFSSSFEYKGITLSGLFVWQLGGYVFDAAYQSLMSSGGYGGAKHVDILGRWQKPGDVTDIPRLDEARTADFNAGTSTRWLISGNSLSIRSIRLSYNLASSLAKKLKLQDAQVIFSGENLGILSKRRGMNPQSAFSGVTSNEYGFSRTFAGGLSLTF
jgi:TonB-linked SusC/RagA family outer membrane protein